MHPDYREKVPGGVAVLLTSGASDEWKVEYLVAAIDQEFNHMSKQIPR